MLKQLTQILQKKYHIPYLNIKHKTDYAGKEYILIHRHPWWVRITEDKISELVGQPGTEINIEIPPSHPNYLQELDQLIMKKCSQVYPLPQQIRKPSARH